MDQPEPKVETSDRFEEFWNVYPKKTGKKAARAKFAAAVKAGSDADALIEGARRYADACVGRDPHSSGRRAGYPRNAGQTIQSRQSQRDRAGIASRVRGARWCGDRLLQRP